MADNVTINPGTGGAVVATDDIGGVNYQRVKISWGADGVANDVTLAEPFPVVDVNIASSTKGRNSIGNVADSGQIALVQRRDADTTLTTGDGQYSVLHQDANGRLKVSASSLPLPTGAATETTLAALQTLMSTLSASVGNHNSPFVDGTPGQVILGKRRDSDSTLVADGDLNTFNMDEEGRLKVASKPASYPDITGDITAVQATIGTPVAGGTVSGDVSRSSNVMVFCTGTFAGVNCTFEGSLEATGDTNWFGVQAVRSNANTIETTTGVLGAQPAYSWELSVNALRRIRVRCTARTSGTQSWRFVQGTYATEPIPAAQVSATQPVSGTVTANWGTITTPTASNVNSAATTNATSVKATAGSVYSITASNTGAAAAFLKLYNKASAPTVGTDVPVLTIPIPASSVQNIEFGTAGHRFTTGIALAITNLAADSDTTAIAASQVKVITAYI